MQSGFLITEYTSSFTLEKFCVPHIVDRDVAANEPARQLKNTVTTTHLIPVLHRPPPLPFPDFIIIIAQRDTINALECLYT